jgi:hypothetical protein
MADQNSFEDFLASMKDGEEIAMDVDFSKQEPMNTCTVKIDTPALCPKCALPMRAAFVDNVASDWIVRVLCDHCNIGWPGTLTLDYETIGEG